MFHMQSAWSYCATTQYFYSHYFLYLYGELLKPKAGIAATSYTVIYDSTHIGSVYHELTIYTKTE